MLYEVITPEPVCFANDVSDLYKMVVRQKVNTFGKIRPNQLIWPTTRPQALTLLDAFLQAGLQHFGTYQDAMTTQSEFLFHSRISFALNTKMLHPLEVIEAAIV